MNPIADIRNDYKMAALNESDLAADPYTQFDRWWTEAINSQIDEVNAFTLCTTDASGMPDGRIVLLKGYDRNGFVFYTNYQSAKGQQLADNPYATLVFFWKELERQVRITGNVEQVSPEESDAYFQSRPLKSRIGAIASKQSAVIPSRHQLEERFEALSEAHREKDPERPAGWGGYRVQPYKVEFWQGRRSRLHDRLCFSIENGAWAISRLSP